MSLNVIWLILICLLIIGSYVFSNIILMVLAVVFVTIFYITKYKAEKYLAFSDPKVTELHHKLMSVFPESRKIKISGSDKSFTINKKHIYLCLKDEKGNYYDDNSLMHVLLHEYAHVLCDEIDEEREHKPKFKRIFGDLIQRAKAGGIYDPDIPMIDNYCGYN